MELGSETVLEIDERASLFNQARPRALKAGRWSKDERATRGQRGIWSSCLALGVDRDTSQQCSSAIQLLLVNDETRSCECEGGLRCSEEARVRETLMTLQLAGDDESARETVS